MYIKTNCNLLIIALCAALLSMAKTQPLLDFEALLDECLASNNISRTEYEVMANQTSSEEDLDDVDMRFKCFTFCLAEKLDILDPEGLLDIDKVAGLEDLSEEKREIFEECKQAYDAEENQCEYAFKMFLCVMDELEQSEEEA